MRFASTTAEAGEPEIDAGASDSDVDTENPSSCELAA
jgi:hypothetical protein